jgi:nucleoside-diphosphate-sugar epimerase
MSLAAPRLFCFGLGLCARRLALKLLAEGWSVAGTSRPGDAPMVVPGVEVVAFDGRAPGPQVGAAMAGASHVLSSVPPDADGDPVVRHHGADVAAMPGLQWVGYLSSSAVYGDTGGASVDETAPPAPTSARARRRVAAEAAWLALGRDHGVAVHRFRLSGIYGPGRSALDRVRDGTARRILAPGHRFQRIHVDDVAAVLAASMAAPNPGAVYNVADDVPAAAADVVAHACALLRVEAPAPLPLAEALGAMSPMGRSFWNDRRHMDTGRLRRELGVRLDHPDYRAGLAAILAEEQAKG